jgi:hypothetical protein
MIEILEGLLHLFVLGQPLHFSGAPAIAGPAQRFLSPAPNDSAPKYCWSI